MHLNKCRDCGLVNAASDWACRRCGHSFDRAQRTGPRSPREAAKQSSWIWTILVLVVVGAMFYYLFSGFEKSYDQIKAGEANRLAAQPKQSPPPLTSRSEYDQHRAEPYKNAVANSPGLAASQKHNEEVKQLMQPSKQAPK